MSQQFRRDETRADVLKFMRDLGYPFEPLRIAPTDVWPTKPLDGNVRWLFSCTKLGIDGRCTIYEFRPYPCRIYEPGEDEMCVHHSDSYGTQKKLEG